MPATQSSQITVHKLDLEGKEVWRYTGVLMESDPNKIVIHALFDRDAVDVAGLILNRGDRFIELFYFDRWYNIFTIYDGASAVLKGWYCNITRPARLEGNNLYAEDLALDLIVFPDHSYVILDNDEFEALELSETDRAQALAALDELIQRVEYASSPFTPA